MEVSVLASGSSGNCTLIKTKESKFLVDVGLSCKQTVKKLASKGYDLDEINAIFITHEHIDHIRGLNTIARKFDTPVFMNSATYESSFFSKSVNLFDGMPFSIEDIQVTPINVNHDAANTVGFVLENNRKLGIFTDLGTVSDEMRQLMPDFDAIVLESNHDIDMLINGPYPYHLKQRILSDKGHLSNIDAGLFIRDCAGEKLRNVFLAHLSRNNNTAELAYNTFQSLISQNKELCARPIITNQFESTELIKI
ncbi:MBL fold metallo-hydrolase [Candidatus Woesearchaeota archaeon]|nr:MBL fold metallo-hydrolase [Candidatus Woesearchaeota archaeon]